ncbi:hypothetical protein LIER_41351 [Lithospermum erythrorhizon]|uniref:GAG-pre-integrase domain-containing protein n=1 Tax=Lithospermum erythrorhizon TaxID=34254 RepID=A0AAV3RB62_LITER
MYGGNLEDIPLGGEEISEYRNIELQDLIDFERKRVLGVTKKINGLFVLNSKSFSKQEIEKYASLLSSSLKVVNIVNAIDAKVWHNRLGHTSEAVLKHILPFDDVHSLNNSPCMVCPLAKQQRLPSSNLNWKSPYKIYFSAQPSIDHLKVFGCLCFFSNHSTHKTKLDPRAIPGVFIGYPSGQKGYKVYDLVSKKVVITRDVKFLEHSFHLHHTFQKSHLFDIDAHTVNDDTCFPSVSVSYEPIVADFVQECVPVVSDATSSPLFSESSSESFIATPSTVIPSDVPLAPRQSSSVALGNNTLEYSTAHSSFVA